MTLNGKPFSHLLLLVVALFSLMLQPAVGQNPLLRIMRDDQFSSLALRTYKQTYDSARQKYESAKKLFEQGLMSQEEFNDIRTSYTGAEVRYQQQMLTVIFQAPYILVESAIKYQTGSSEKRVKLTLTNTTGGNLEYEKLLEEHSDLFTIDVRPDRIYNVFVSLANTSDGVIISNPYEIKIPFLKMGESTTVDFGLLRDIESVRVLLAYGNAASPPKDVFLQKDASADMASINSTQFSQEADLRSSATYDITLEQYSQTDNVFQMAVLNLPKQIAFEFKDADQGARVSQVKFTEGITNRKLNLTVQLPERADESVVVDEPITFWAVVMSKAVADELGEVRDRSFTQPEIDDIRGGKVKMELIPRGVGRIEVRAQNLYHDIKPDETAAMEVRIKNTGTRRLDNIKLETDNPLGWKSEIQPDMITSLEPEEETAVNLAFLPPADVGVGDYEVTLRTRSMGALRRVEPDDKTIRIHISGRANILGSAILISLLIGLMVGIVVFGVKLSRR
ncbi:NEW3 domain-containing protein [candidate division KSB1 bacterium]